MTSNFTLSTKAFLISYSPDSVFKRPLINGGAIALLTNVGFANHWVVAYELRGSQVRVADPLFGMRWQSVSSLDQQSVPLLVKVERKL